MISNILLNTHHLTGDIKTGCMPWLKIKQLQSESDAWKRLLVFMMNENIHLKNRLSEVLKDGVDNLSLNEMESFQNNFIGEDEVIQLLRKDIDEVDNLLLREVFENGKILRRLNKKMKTLRESIIIAEKKFGRIKSDFHGYLSENIA